ncbi:MAG: helix-turn-helix transcriptional regulator [Meiothermus sp.]|nr:helix-turn-helix transcriptional regulator [Meiothermus sp.]
MEQQLLKEVQNLMDTKGITQAEYARAKGVSRQTVNQLFSGKRGLLTESAAELLEYLGVEIRLVPKGGKNA